MRVQLGKTKGDLILKTKDLLSILEVKIKEITTHYFETLKNSMTYSPLQIGKIIDETGKYEFGKAYHEYANSLPSSERQSDCVNIESSESDNNSPLQAPADQHAMILKRGSNNTNIVKFQYDEKFDNEFNGWFII